MSVADIERAIADYADAGERVRASGADGLEITATKGYLIHQFLNPAINRRTDEWGGDPDRRFLFLKKTVDAVRARVGADYLVGIRLSAADFNYSPFQLSLFRFPGPLTGANNGSATTKRRCWTTRTACAKRSIICTSYPAMDFQTRAIRRVLFRRTR